MLPLDELDIIYMNRALELAEAGRGSTYPNPVVGAVIVRGGQVVAEGYHAGPGLDHAEVVALKQIKDASGATLYVTLEPCCSYGRTPPCTTAIIGTGVARVVVGAVDPSPQVNGRGIAQLREAGIEVDVAEGDIALRCMRQNNGFRKSVATGLPFVSYKYAMTLDGRVAADSGDSRWVSGEESRAYVHGLRAFVDVVMVGAGTVRQDDPLLTARGVGCRRQPLRVIIDGRLRLSSDAALVRSTDEGAVLIVCSPSVDDRRRAEVESWGVETAVAADDEREGCLSPRAVAELLGSRGLQSVLLEGGPTLAGSWWDAGLVDQVIAFVAPRVISGRTLRSPLIGVGTERMAMAVSLREIQTRTLGQDLCISGYVGEAY